MPITFKSKHSPSILMLEAMAMELIRLMGHSGEVPGSLAKEDVANAVHTLERAIAVAPARPMSAERTEGDDEAIAEPVVSVAHRALPLIQMLRKAQANGDYVIWDR